jgi:putative two-component system hydrogenase maturation factor HypX/HoxX
VWAHEGVLLNPHYKNMGNLYGSEYWTYLLPRRVGPQRAKDIMRGRLPVNAAQAAALGLVDQVMGADSAAFEPQVMQQALDAGLQRRLVGARARQAAAAR